MAERPREHPARRRAHQALADPRRAPPPHEPRPGEAAEQRRRVHQDEPLDPLGMTCGEREADGDAPVVGDELDRVDVHLGQEPLEEPGEPRERVVEVAALPGAPEPDQVGRDPTREGEELDPVVRARRNPVEIQNRHARRLCGAVEDGRLVEVDRVLVDAHPVARITSARVSTTSPTSPTSRTSPTSPDPPPPGAPTLCLGDAIVDLICESAVGAVSDGDAFVPHLGGSAATIAVTAARHGARVAVGAGAGDDAWGRWLRDRLRREGVETEWFELVPGARTPVVDRRGGLGRGAEQ